MLALKLASLAQGASGVASGHHRAAWKPCWRNGLTPVIPAQGSVGASWRPGPAGAHGRRHDRGGRDRSWRCVRIVPADPGSGGCRARPARRSGPKEGLALLNGTQFSHGQCAGRVCSRPSGCSRRPWSPAHCSRPRRRRARTPPSIHRIHVLRRQPGQIDTVGDALRAADGRLGDPRVSHREGRRAGAGSLLPALPAAGDGRGAGRAAPGGDHAWAYEANGVSRQSARSFVGEDGLGPTRRCRAATSTRSRSRSRPT